MGFHSGGGGGGDQRRQAELGGKIGAGRGMVVEVIFFRFFIMVLELTIFYEYF